MGIGDTQKLILLAARLQTLAEDMLQLSETNVADIEQRIQQRTHSKTEDILPNVKQNRIWCCFKLSKSGDEESQSRGDLKVNLLMTGHSKV